MRTSPAPALSDTDRALAAWESSFVQNIGPRLTEEEHAAAWAAVLAFRESRDLTALTEALRAVVAGAYRSGSEPIAIVTAALAQLAILFPTTTADADKE